MHSYLQRHIRTHGSGVSMPCSGGKGKDGVVVKANVGGVTTTTTLLNPITLETNENSGSLIVSQPALNIPPNTSQNYFMIQTASGLQLIPLSSPVPAPPPPPPPPPAQPQNYLLLQCPSNNGSQSSLILVPTASNLPPAQDTQALPMLQSFQAVQSVLNQTPQAQLSQFSTLAQQQQQQTRILITSNSNNMNSSIAMPTQTLSANSLLTKPILGRTTRTGGRRGRKPKSALQKSQSSASQNTGGVAAVPNSHATSVAQASAVANTTSGPPPSSNTMSQCPLSTSCTTVSIHSTSSTVAPLVDTSGPPSSVTMVSPATTVTAAQVSPPVSVMPQAIAQTTLEEIRTEETMSEKQFVLCFDNEGESKEDMGGSYVLQFEDGGSGGAVDGGVVAEGNSLVLQIKTNGQHDGEKEGDKGGMMSLLQDWGEEKQGGRQTGEEGNQGESYVLHFHTDAESSPNNDTFSRGQETSLQLTCTPNSSLVPLDGQEVVFKLGAGTKMEQAPEEGMHMIALIGDEGGMAGELAHCSTATGGVAEDGGAMEGIFQLESGEGIVIIEVSTSGLRDGEMERGEGREICQTSETVEAKETSTKKNNPADNTEVQTSAEDAMTIGPLHEKEMHFSD